MSLRVVGAGLGRTGTHSLKIALEQLLGGPCYHMFEVMEHPADIQHWQAAAEGQMPDWAALFANYRAAVDWPVASYWQELAGAFPDAIVLLSVRPTDGWWNSANQTIWAVMRRPDPPDPMPQAQLRMVRTMLATRFTPDWGNEKEARAAYQRHNELVRMTIPSQRLVEWRPGDGWDPLCRALGVPIPPDPFPHANTTDDFRAMAGLTGAEPA
jgi:hypothetical protein